MALFATLKWKFFYTFLGVIAVCVVIFLFVTREKQYDFETELVSKRDITQIITETGMVEADANVSLSFEISGRLKKIFVTEGESVTEGTVLASLDDATLYADLLSAEASVAVQDAKLRELQSNTTGGDSVSYQNLLAEQNVAVQNARRALLSTDLEAVSEVEFGTGSAPTISGTYTSDEEGSYFVTVYPSATQSGASFTVSGLETGSGPANQTSPAALGTRGLYIKFPSGTIDTNKTWIVSIPNTRSSTYTTRLNAYEAAVKTRDLTLSQTETTSYQIAIQEAQINQARAALNRAQIAYDNAKLTAPFSGVISEIYPLAGETVSALSPIMNLVSSAQYKIEVYIPEDDIAHVEVGDQADITFDAYPGDVFKGHVNFVAPVAIDNEGVNVFKTIIEFDELDPKIKAGLSADIDIIADTRTQVLSVPSRSVVHEDNQNFVRVFRNGTLSRIPVTIGLQGSYGYIEITGGVNEGDEIVTFISDETLDALSP